MIRRLLVLSSLALALSATQPLAASIVVTAFNPSVFNPDTAAMDAALGISGFAIEDFEDTTLLAGLSYSLKDPDGGEFTALPRVFDGTSFGNALDPSTNNFWDQSGILLSNSENNLGTSGGQNPGIEGVRANTVTFHVAGGATSFGIGLSNFQSLNTPDFPFTDHNIYVNGVLLGKLETIAAGFFTPGRVRNTYLRFDASGDLIHSVTFKNIITAPTVDLLAFDHIAIQGANAVPEPGGMLTFGLLSLIAGWRCRRKPRLHQGADALASA